MFIDFDGSVGGLFEVATDTDTLTVLFHYRHDLAGPLVCPYRLQDAGFNLRLQLFFNLLPVSVRDVPRPTKTGKTDWSKSNWTSTSKLR